MGRGRIEGSVSRSLLNLDQSEASDAVHRWSAARVTAEPQRAGCAPAHRADAAPGLSRPGGCFRPLSSPIQRRSDLTGCCAVVVCATRRVGGILCAPPPSAGRCSRPIFAIRRCSRRLNGSRCARRQGAPGRVCRSPTRREPFPSALRRLTKVHASWFGGGHPTLVLILRCGAAASEGGLQPAARSLELSFEAPDAGTAG
jgi:hypothetical protein